jgi:hypothetical protein
MNGGRGSRDRASSMARFELVVDLAGVVCTKAATEIMAFRCRKADLRNGNRLFRLNSEIAGDAQCRLFLRPDLRGPKIDLFRKSHPS